MYFVICLAVLQLATCSIGAEESAVAQAFRNDFFVRKVVLKPPTEFISVNYTDTSINLGTKVEPLQTLTQPKVSYEADVNLLYTLIFMGPDLPPSVLPPLSQFLHWLVVNIPGDDISKGFAVSSYFPPVPYPGGFPYVFLLYKQPERLNTSQLPNLSPILSRPRFRASEFVKQYNLEGPIAGNFMRESYLEIIPQVLQTVADILG